jgi:hypothetical protein
MSTQQKYTEYLEKNLAKYVTNIPNIDIIKNYLNNGADVNSYYLRGDFQDYRRDYVPGQTLLYGLVKIIPQFSGTKSRLKRITDIMEYILDHADADVDQGFTNIHYKTRRPLTHNPTQLIVNPYNIQIKTPLTYAIENRIITAIRILVDHGATVSARDKNMWLDYISESRSDNEREKLIEIMKLLQPGFILRDPNNPELRNVPHNAENAISFDDIKNGTIMVDINEEYLGPPGVLGPHSHFYSKAMWDRWEAQLKASGLPVTSPFTKKPLISKEVYKARVLPPPSEEENKKNNAQSSSENNSAANSAQATMTTTSTTTSNNSNTRSNNTHGGKRRKQKKTRKLKRRSVH